MVYIDHSGQNLFGSNHKELCKMSIIIDKNWRHFPFIDYHCGKCGNRGK